MLSRLTEECRGAVSPGGSPRLRAATLRLLEGAHDDDRFPVQPPRLLADIRAAVGRSDVLVSDVGLHKLWIGRAFPACEPGTTLIANGLAGMGFAVPATIAAKLVRPQAKVVAVSGDGGFLMNAQELETARRLGTAFVSVVWENGQFGSIAWKQDARFGRHFGTDFTNPPISLACPKASGELRSRRAHHHLNRSPGEILVSVTTINTRAGDAVP
ncbi:MAG: thiamine pyrophosphate-dependent enzyme [Streptosporangiaceae bacterium]